MINGVYALRNSSRARRISRIYEASEIRISRLRGLGAITRLVHKVFYPDRRSIWRLYNGAAAAFGFSAFPPTNFI